MNAGQRAKTFPGESFSVGGLWPGGTADVLLTHGLIWAPPTTVTPAKAGANAGRKTPRLRKGETWVPAFAGRTQG
jgi:hypothetical protein